MGNLSEFFNRSEFVVRARNNNDKAITIDEEYKLELEVYDALVLDTPALVSASLATQNGRDVFFLPTIVDAVDFGKFTYLFTFTIDGADWNGTDELILKLEVTDNDAYVYKLDYMIKA